jgi:hypothetical protein
MRCITDTGLLLLLARGMLVKHDMRGILVLGALGVSGF